MTTKTYEENGLIVEESPLMKRFLHVRNGKRELHNGNGPAKIEYRVDGSIVRERYYHNGEYSNPSGAPAQLCYDRNGKIHRTSYAIGGETHRDGDLPAVIDIGGETLAYWYYKNGELHRETGPAYYIQDSTNLKIIEESYYINGVEFSKKKFKNKFGLNVPKEIQTKFKINGFYYEIVESKGDDMLLMRKVA